MIKKSDCNIGVISIINEKKTKWNEELGAQNNGLVSYDWTPTGTFCIGDDVREIVPGTEIEILSKPKKVLNSGVHVKFKITGEDKIFAAWWICFLHKVDIIKK